MPIFTDNDSVSETNEWHTRLDYKASLGATRPKLLPECIQTLHTCNGLESLGVFAVTPSNIGNHSWYFLRADVAGTTKRHEHLKRGLVVCGIRGITYDEGGTSSVPGTTAKMPRPCQCALVGELTSVHGILGDCWNGPGLERSVFGVSCSAATGDAVRGRVNLEELSLCDFGRALRRLPGSRN
ncbi:hypothetical protein MCOR07_008193 [Pyricularia oryzae]|uniref:Uncharacterized protein n=1 Tax=Pyricularia grisea TaxID=148305 RepID=A0ABQ8NXV8_PYRGI|nr:hypothetical protein MCOR01_003671 [Pyricularia oryzae]KAI6303705.1 hypothetical protein MCOR33_001228 [Pyricularia grisea]KAI6262410.1 hypothetical protein MCOR19_001447 [Pyricularia oryzae]KAI6316730.1 hypothetical protein MCOR34_004227 [Pyricularia oryzae]KAI6338405.1 hypothetical protein MCOR30_003073 [Pyricularia oryzae]